MFDFLKLKNWWRNKKVRLFTAFMRGSVGAIGSNSFLVPPFQSFNLKQLYMGNNSSIMSHAWIECVASYAGIEFSPRLEIGDNVSIGRMAHIIACGNMKIGNGVVLAERVFISDSLHGFEDINMSVMPQPLKHPGPVIIEDDVWIGDGACVLPNVTIGKHSVVGSNAVVTKSVPPYSIVAGIPAKVIKRYNPETEEWERC